MKQSHSRFVFVSVIAAVLVAFAVLRFRLDERSTSAGVDAASVTASQRPAIEAILATESARFKLDDQGRVTSLIAQGAAFTDAVATRLAELPHLTDLQIKDTTIDTEGLLAIGSLDRLESLRIEKTDIASENWSQLESLKNLRHLFVVESSMNDEGLKSLRGLNHLEVLDLSRTEITDAGLAQLAGISSLNKLYLIGTGVTGTGFADFPEDSGLSLLNLSEAPLTVEGIAQLARFRNLTALYLDRVKMDDAMIAQLMNIAANHFTNLNALSLTDTPLTDSAIAPLSALANMPQMSLVSLHGSRISKSAFKRLAQQTPEVRYQVDYDAKED